MPGRLRRNAARLNCPSLHTSAFNLAAKCMQELSIPISAPVYNPHGGVESRGMPKCNGRFLGATSLSWQSTWTHHALDSSGPPWILKMPRCRSNDAKQAVLLPTGAPAATMLLKPNSNIQNASAVARPARVVRSRPPSAAPRVSLPEAAPRARPTAPTSDDLPSITLSLLWVREAWALHRRGKQKLLRESDIRDVPLAPPRCPSNPENEARR